MGEATTSSSLTICLVCSHGGHLAEMLQLGDAFAGHAVFYFCYDADTTRRLPDAFRVSNRPYSPFEFLRNLGRAIRIFRRRRPDLVVSTGAEIAIPVVLVAKVFRTPVIYIECGAQVARPSVTGRILYYLADEFYVQWPELLRAYGSRARFEGSLVDEVKSIPRQGGAEI
ncbi:MAG: capsular biosynthesis protein [Candidatus Hydrogenedentes bacterium]|nr:capsular biosynthesis protein [Candidatus Hydrogenedentota bacterium]